VLSVLNWSYQWYKPTAALSIAEVANHFTALTLRAPGVGDGERARPR
jgi:Tetracyclin repressor-like, C-terminal domain